MKYIEIYESKNKHEFYYVVDALKKENIDVRKLYEYKLYPELIYDAGGYAILHVLEKDYQRAQVIIKRLISSDIETTGLSHDYSELDQHIFKKESQAIKKDGIAEVHYILANNMDYDFEDIHSVDFGVVLKFNSGKYLSWYFVERTYDSELVKQYPQFYQISFENILNNPEVDYKIIEVKSHRIWDQICKETIIDLSFYSQDYEGAKVITDVIISTENRKFAIYSIDEPLESEEEMEFNLSIGNNWSVIVFDEELMKLRNR